MPYYFGNAYFGVRVGGVGRSVDTDVSVMHIPGSNTNYVDIGGRGELRLNFQLYFATEENYKALEALVGTQDTLYAFDDTYANALLKSLNRSFSNPNARQTIAEAYFIVPELPA